MKKIFTLILCLLMLTVLPSCGKKDADEGGISIKDIPTASADSQDEDLPKSSADEFDEKYSAEEDEEYINYETKAEDHRSERERVEIENSIRDAEALVESGDYEDAMMIIKNLKTRKLSKEESERITELQKQMITISD